jgi:hypothetical protein
MNAGSYTMCHLVTKLGDHEKLNATSVYKTYKGTMKNMEINLGINSGMSTTILATVHYYHTAKHE